MQIEKHILPRELFLEAEDQNTTEKLVTIWNQAWGDLYRLLENRVSLKDNIQAVVADIQFNYPDLYATPTWASGFSDWNAASDGPVVFRKVGGGWAEISGLGKGTLTGSNPQTILTVPAGFAPATHDALFVGTANTTVKIFSLKTTSNGILQIEDGAAGTDVPLKFPYRYRLADPTPLRPSGDFPLNVDCTQLGLRPSGLIVMRTEVLERRTSRIVANGNPVWESATDGKRITVRIKDFEGLSPGRYRVRVLCLP